MADSVFTINSEGKIQRLPALARDTKRLRSMRELVSAQQDGEGSGNEKVRSPSPARSLQAPSVHPPAAENMDDIRKGDRSLYHYYLGSVKWPLLILSLCLIVMSSVSDRTPGEHILNTTMTSILTIRKVIFLRIWLEKEPENNSYFIGYAALGVSKVLFSSLSW